VAQFRIDAAFVFHSFLAGESLTSSSAKYCPPKECPLYSCTLGALNTLSSLEWWDQATAFERLCGRTGLRYQAAPSSRYKKAPLAFSLQKIQKRAGKQGDSQRLRGASLVHTEILRSWYSRRLSRAYGGHAKTITDEVGSVGRLGAIFDRNTTELQEFSWYQIQATD
jgi:hypothetical protein